MLSPSSATTAASRFLVSPSVRVTLSRALASQLSQHVASAVTSSPQQLQLRCYGTGEPSSSSSSGGNSCNNGGSSNTSVAAVGGGSSRQPWAMTARRQNTTSLRAHRSRPIVNGEAVAFHVSDLLDAPFKAGSRQQQQQQPPMQKKTLVQQQQNAAAAAAAAAAVEPCLTRRSYESDMVVILDMDECIIHSQFLSSPAAAQVYAHQLKAQQRHHHNDATKKKKAVDNFRFSLPDGDLVHVNVRPGLTEFLKAVTDRFETHVFTAAVDVYAKPLLDRLDPTGTMFAGRWYREHCAWDADQGAYVKDLSRLPIYEGKPDRVVLVDNNPLSFLANPSNGILVSSFYSDASDQTLPAVWDLLNELDTESDVRPVLEERFGLTRALRDVQGSTGGDGAAKSL